MNVDEYTCIFCQILHYSYDIILVHDCHGNHDNLLPLCVWCFAPTFTKKNTVKFCEDGNYYYLCNESMNI